MSSLPLYAELGCLDSVAEGTPLQLNFNFGPIDHPIYGQAQELKGHLHFLLPMGSIPVSTYFGLSEDEQNVILGNTVKRCGRLHEEWDEEQLRHWCRTINIVAALCFPRVPTDSPLFEVVLDMIDSAYFSDDLFDNMDEFPFQVTTSFLYKNYNVWEKVFAGELERVKELTALVPGWDTCYEVFVAAMRKIQKVIPAADVSPIMRSLFISAEGVFLNLEALHSETEGDVFSEEAKRIIRGYDAGLGVFAELGAVVAEATLPSHVRQSLLFRILSENMRIFGGLINDILGVNKDIVTGDTDATVVLRRVVEQGMSLQDAVDLETRRLRSIIKDVKVCAKKLVDAFPDEESVARLAQFAVEFIDGQIYANVIGAQRKSRYGTLQMEIVPAQ